jgi:hypothetical protein
MCVLVGRAHVFCLDHRFASLKYVASLKNTGSY